MTRIDPRVDLAFKKIFGVEENKDLLISLINSIVSQEDQVADLTLRNPYNFQNFKNDKLSILDIKARGLDGKMFNIEIQMSDEDDYPNRALYYWSKLYTDQMRSGDEYSILSKTIGIHLLNFTSIPEAKKYHNVFHIAEDETHIRYFNNLEIHTIELNKFADSTTTELADLVAKISTALDVWAAFLTRCGLLHQNDLPKSLDNAQIRKAIDVLEVMSFKDEEREAYEDRLKWMLIETSAIKKVQRESREEGRVEGREEGKLEALHNIAKLMLSRGHSIDEVADLTGLMQNEITKLK